MKVNQINNYPARQNNSFHAKFSIRPYEKKELPNSLEILSFAYRKIKNIPEPNPYRDLELYLSGMLAPLKPYDAKVYLHIYDEAGTSEITCFPPNETSIGKAYCAKVGNVHSKDLISNVYNSAKEILDTISEKYI